MFNKELFYSLCKQHGVELSDKYDRPMIREGNTIKELTEKEINNILSPSNKYFVYKNMENKTKLEVPLSFEISNHPVAC